MKWVLCVWMVITIVICTGCQKSHDGLNVNTNYGGGENMNSSTDIEKQFTSEIAQKTEDILTRANTEPMDKLITTIYSESQLFSAIHILNLYNPMVSYQQYLDEIDTIAPIECIRKTSDETAYSIYKTEKGLVYLFFKNLYNRWVLYNSVYVQKSLSIEDFHAVSVLDTMDEVGIVDPAESEIKLLLGEAVEAAITVHLAKNGIAVIWYQAQGGDLVVSNVQTFDNFQWTDYQWDKQGITYDYQILDQDYLVDKVE